MGSRTPQARRILNGHEGRYGVPAACTTTVAPSVPMPSSHPRVQVTVDPELAAAMAAIDPHPPSRSRLIRDLALRGAEAERDARERRRDAIEHLLSIARGETDYGFQRAREIHAERDAGVG